MENILRDTSDERFEFLKEVECMCMNFYKEKEEEENIILFINELKSYIRDLSIFFKNELESSERLGELNTLQKIIKTKESLEAYILDEHLRNQKRPQKAEQERVEKAVAEAELEVDEVKEELKRQSEKRGETNSSSLENELDGKKESGIEQKEGENEYEKKKKITDKKNIDTQIHANSNEEEALRNVQKKLENDNYNALPKDLNERKEQKFIMMTSKEKTKEKSVAFNLDESSEKEQQHSTKGKNSKEKETEKETKKETEKETKKETEKETKKETEKNIRDYCIQDERHICVSDDMLREWSRQIDKYDNLLYEYSYEYKKNNILRQINNKKKKRNVSNENIDEELCLLAQEMKENVLTYREILNEDNKLLEQTASKQLLHIDAISDVSKKTKKLNQNKNISFFISLLIISVSILLFILTFTVVLFL